jgi:enediyne biosynthesis protein E4
MNWLALALYGTAASAALFVDVTGPAGISWRHSNGQSMDHYLVESTTGGAGFFDFDNDGLLDIFLVKGHGAQPVHCALYRNLGSGKFADVAQAAGVADIPFYGMGIAASDYDNDGFTDFYVTGYPAGALFHNNRNGTFTNVTATAGVQNQGQWGASAAWFDYDRDGRLDLFVANYVQFSYSEKKHCLFGTQPTYCAQTEYQGSVSRLFHNNGDGTFSDVTARAGIENLSGRGLGVVAVDADGDGWPDLFVARDASPNLLLINQHDGTFRDAGLEKEIAYNADGVARSGMGVDAGDLNGDGRPDFVVTNFDHEYHALYLSNAAGGYKEATVSSGLARLTRPYVGWGVKFVDFDNDGALDLLIANGHLHEQINMSNREVNYREPILLLKNDGTGRFRRAEIPGGPILGRGLATGDFDNDGFVDAIVMNLNARPVLLHNSAASGHSWVGVKLQGTHSNRDAIGSRLTLRSSNGTMTRWIVGGGSFLSSNDRRVVFGLGGAREAGALEILWPDQRKQTVPNPKLNSYTTITEPAGDGGK